MPAVEFIPDQKTFEVPPGAPLVKVAQQAGVDVELPCGGDGSCGRCVVRTSGGAVETESLGRIPASATAALFLPHTDLGRFPGVAAALTLGRSLPAPFAVNAERCPAPT